MIVTLQLLANFCITSIAVDLSRDFLCKHFYRDRWYLYCKKNTKSSQIANQEFCNLSTRFPNLFYFPSIATAIRSNSSSQFWTHRDAHGAFLRAIFLQAIEFENLCRRSVKGSFGHRLSASHS